ncbi:izumo sperm-egg fusion protein 1 [Protopterus annectens]|uniref:izumo sperm-egg fusion protein 1 n=1 Tax=Protopterus annectens TaxID=7888 RepID=UPI001CFBC731|nr:izumo sperm-egg fusion protein 1 [Protopterus annectens]
MSSTCENPDNMSWAAFLLTLLCLPTITQTCLNCDLEVKTILNNLKETYLYAHIQEHAVAEKLVNYVKAAESCFFHASLKFSGQGFIDESTLIKAAHDFKRELKRMIDTHLEGIALINTLIKLMKAQCLLLETHIKVYVQQGFCPNTCGTMLQEAISCQTCEKVDYICPQKQVCEDRRIQIGINEDLKLDCGFSWHALAKHLQEYQFFKLTQNGSAWTETLISKSKEPTLVIHRIKESDSGHYMCLLKDHQQNIISKFSYNVEVTRGVANEETIWTRLTLPPVEMHAVSRHSEKHRNIEQHITHLIILTIVGSGGGITAFILASCFMIHRRKKEAMADKEDEEDNEEEP